MTNIFSLNVFRRVKGSLRHLSLYAVTLTVGFISLLMASQEAAAGLTAEQVAAKAAAFVGAGKSVAASFTLSSGGRSTSGTVRTSGEKFTVSLPEYSTWYNGKTLYTYNPRINETTVTIPTTQELMDSNPLLYIKGKSGYTYNFSSVKRNGKYVVDIIPVNKKAGVKKVTLTVNSTTFYPEKIAVTTTGGNTVVTVTSFKPSVNIASSEFEYPKSKYPKAEIVDLR